MILLLAKMMEYVQTKERRFLARINVTTKASRVKVVIVPFNIYVRVL